MELHEFNFKKEMVNCMGNPGSLNPFLSVLHPSGNVLHHLCLLQKLIWLREILSWKMGTHGGGEDGRKQWTFYIERILGSFISLL